MTKVINGFFRDSEKKQNLLSLFKEIENETKKELISSISLTEKEMEKIMIKKRKEIIRNITKRKKCSEKKALFFTMTVLIIFSILIFSSIVGFDSIMLFLFVAIIILATFSLVNISNIETCSCDRHLLLRAIGEEEIRKNFFL